jgi:hypothetical protein
MSTPQEVNQTKLHELQSRIVDIDAQVASLDNDYADIAADFPNNGALKRAAAIESRVTTLRREKALALAAQSRIKQQQQDEAAQAAQAVERERASKAREIATAIMALHSEIDLAVKQLCEQCARRVSLLAQLAQTELVDSAMLMRLSGRAPLTRAACYHGLHRFLELQVVSPQGMIALSDSNSLLAGVAAPAAPTRQRLSNGS